MDSFELNKIFGAILGTLLFVMGVGFLAEAVYHPTQRGPGYELPLPEGDAEAGPVEEVPQLSLGTLLASADAGQGEAVTRRCQACHNFVEGAGNKAGPELYDVVGRQIGTETGFNYSASLNEMGAAGDTWTYQHLYDFIFAPKAFAPDTKMSFGGIKNPEELANLLAYLSTLSASPVPFPAPEPEAAAEGATVEAEIGATPGDTDVVVPTEAEAIETPTETQSDTPVEGTPATSGTEAAPPAPEAAPAEGEPVPEVPAQ